MSSEDCATQINNSLNQDPRCADNSQDKVPVSPVEQVAVFSVIYGIIFLVTIVGKRADAFTRMYLLIAQDQTLHERIDYETEATKRFKT